MPIQVTHISATAHQSVSEVPMASASGPTITKPRGISTNEPSVS